MGGKFIAKGMAPYYTHDKSIRITENRASSNAYGGGRLFLRLERNPEQQETEVIVKYAEMDQDVKRLISLLQAADTKILCESKDGEKVVKAADIFYIESVDKRTYVYCENEVYRTQLRLYQLLDMLSDTDFVQINKACILNINVLDTIKTLFNSRMEAMLKNGERLYVTRKYLNGIKNKLRGEEA
ncbi:LytTR family DNA-binding domain-containing protein [Kineothrix sedimenti]|uniref:LytTR family DNA-binding domain-containing protein n=1 Tax=Kineothrix sedimenti TaxID=3123317 RepID=A0ABZ3F1T9_9FIRM